MTDPVSSAYESLAAALADRGVVASKLFGKAALKAPNGKAIACAHGGVVAFKLGTDSPAYTEAMALTGAKVFEPAEGRPMKGWVALPVDHQAAYERYALAALDLVG